MIIYNDYTAIVRLNVALLRSIAHETRIKRTHTNSANKTDEVAWQTMFKKSRYRRNKKKMKSHQPLYLYQTSGGK